MLQKPSSSEYHEFYQTYISKVSEITDILDYLEKQRLEVVSLLENMVAEKQQYAYAKSKWTVKELLRHIIDAEKIFAHRAFSISKDAKTALTGMDQDDYITETDDSNNTFSALVQEFDLQRQYNIQMIKNLHKSKYIITGTASGSAVTVRANIYIIAGHTAHHLEILKTRYL